MAAETLEERVARLEGKVQEVEERLAVQTEETQSPKRGWRWFVGIFADSPDFEEAVRISQEWRAADRPADAASQPSGEVS
jgi:hypothetical protein